MSAGEAVLATIGILIVGLVLFFGGCNIGSLTEKQAWVHSTKLDRIPFIPLDCRNAPVQARGEEEKK